MQNFSASGSTHRTAFCNHRHRPKTLPRRVFCTNEKRINNKLVGQQPFIKNPVRQKKKLTAAIFTHTKTSFQIIRENILLSENQKKNTVQKNSLYYTEKNSRFVRVFCKILYTLFTIDFSITKKYPSIIQRKN